MKLKKIAHFGFLTAMAAATLGVAQGAEYSTPQVRLPLMATPPTIDGEIRIEEWQGAARMERFGRPAPLSVQDASFWVGATGKELFIAVTSEAPPGARLVANAKPMPDETDTQTFFDDSIELVLDPLRELEAGNAGRRKLYHAIFNAKGAIYDKAHRLRDGGEEWRGHWRIGSKAVGNRWYMEIAIPWADLGVGQVTGHTMGIRIGRNWQQSIEPLQTEWSPLGGDYLVPDTMPQVIFDPAAPVVQTRQIQDAKTRSLHYQVAVFNPHSQPVEVRALLEAEPADSPSGREERTLKVAPGETGLVELSAPFITQGEEIASNILVTSPDEKTVYYRRNWSWKLGRPGVVWKLIDAKAKDIDAAFAYYPSYDRMKVKVNLSGLKEKAGVHNVNLAVRLKGARQPLATTKMPPLKNDATQLDEWKLPALSDGEYELVVSLDGVSAKPEVLPFVRHKFEWEKNRLGKSDVVISPFTPITVQNQTVGTVLRQHAMNEVGLWDQVTADGRPLLKSPMRLEAVIGGRASTARGTLKFNTRKATEVSAQANWSAGGLSGQTISTWDYDGLMKNTFILQPTSQTIESLTLVVPLDDARMPLMHVQADATRVNYAGDTPRGQGRVWESSKAARDEIIGSYVPYIWLGGAERGLSVFGENDKGWIVDSKTPCQEIVRRADGVLELRLNLISQPSRLESARTIQVGFQATPVKPLPQNWRLWTVWDWEPRWKTRVPGSMQQTFLASSRQWGGMTASASDDTFPRDRDYSIYDEFAKTRATGQWDKGFLERWLAGYRPPFDQYVPQYRNSLTSTFTRLARRPQSVMPYTNARGVRLDTPEGQTFLDEWHREPFSKREVKYGQSTTYDMDPVESYRDFALWEYKKMLDTFADTIYFDDTFLQANFDTIGTQAYTLPDGRIQPSVGLWNMRELIRRTAVLEHEMGKTHAIMSHMTNRQLVPILAFSTTQLAWENQAGDAPFQERFSRSYIQAESIGRQSGNVPFALETLVQGNDPVKLAFARRSGTGVLLTHEVKTLGGWNDYWSNYDRLLQFGYGTSQTKVWNYWQDDYPVRITGGATSSLLVTKPGNALAVVCNYGNKGTFTLKLDAQTLKVNGIVAATDLETNTPLEIDANGEIRFALDKYDFKVIGIEVKQ